MNKLVQHPSVFVLPPPNKLYKAQYVPFALFVLVPSEIYLLMPDQAPRDDCVSLYFVFDHFQRHIDRHNLICSDDIENI